MTVSVDLYSTCLLLTYRTDDGYKARISIPVDHTGQAEEEVWDRHQNLIHSKTFPRTLLGATNLNVYITAMANTHRRNHRKVS